MGTDYYSNLFYGILLPENNDADAELISKITNEEIELPDGFKYAFSGNSYVSGGLSVYVVISESELSCDVYQPRLCSTSDLVAKEYWYDNIFKWAESVGLKNFSNQIGWWLNTNVC